MRPKEFSNSVKLLGARELEEFWFCLERKGREKQGALPGVVWQAVTSLARRPEALGRCLSLLGSARLDASLPHPVCRNPC